jgi:cation diffusion facilitator CzcD-associated flavoprotein CzcO
MTTVSAPDHARIAIIGTGFAGIGVAIKLKELGIDFTILERASSVGGTWRDNSYPGCKCDVPSHLYSFSFAPNPEWSHTYSPQPEIWEYLRRTTEEHGILPHIRFGHEVLDAAWDDDTRRWRIETPQGAITADLLIAGNGALSAPSIPEIEGIERFEGTVFHSAQWDHDHDLTGERVAVIGTGASAIQFVPEIQPDVARLHLFQRTAPWVLPHTDRRVTDAERRLYRRFPRAQRLVRAAIYWSREMLVLGLTRWPKLMKPTERMGRANLNKRVQDPVLRAKLTPKFSPGCKRLLLSDDYYPALVQDNVVVVTEAIREVRPRAVVTADGVEHEVDTIIYGTGFRVTDNPIGERVRGRDGQTLAKAWADGGARAYLGSTVPGFPNLFLMTGPNTGIGHTSLVVMIEAQTTYILDCLRTMHERNASTVEVRPEAFEAFNAEVQAKMGRTVWSLGGCASWYLDSHGRNTTLWPDFTFRYRERTKRFDVESYVLGTGVAA